MASNWFSKLKVKRFWLGSTPTEITATATELNVMDGVTASTAELNVMSDVDASAAEINAECDVSASVVSLAGDATTLSLTAALHGGRTVMVAPDINVSQAITLPEASGSFNKYRILFGGEVDGTNTELMTIAMPSSNGIIQGHAIFGETDAGAAVAMFASSATTDSIVMDGLVNGGLVGDYVDLVDVAANVFLVEVVGQQAGTAATPFSAAVS
jgi:hypothetical protein